MRILIVTPHYYPEQFKITEIAESLAKNFEVEVWTNIPNYPQGDFYPKYHWFKNFKQFINGVTIKRLRIIPRKKHVLLQALNYISFYTAGMFRTFFTKKHFDLILNYQLSPVYSAFPGLKMGKKCKVPVITYILDLWPDSLKAMKQITEKSRIFKIVDKHSRRVYLRSDYLFITSQMFQEFLEKIGVSSNRITYIPNFGEEIFENRFLQPEFKINVPQEKFKILFAGNVGKAQDLDSLIVIAQDAKIMKDNSFVFMIVGEGSDKARLEKVIEEHKLQEYFVFYGRFDIKYMPNFYQEADAFYYSLIADEVIQKTMPGKVVSYMAFGKPIIAKSGGESIRVLSEYGASVLLDEKEHHYAKIKECMEHYADLCGRLNVDYYKKNFSKETILEKIHLEIKTILKEGTNV